MGSCPRDAVASKNFWNHVDWKERGLTKNNRQDTCEVKVNRSVVSVDIINTEGVDSVALSRENPMKRPSKSLPVIFLMRVRWVLEIGD